MAEDFRAHRLRVVPRARLAAERDRRVADVETVFDPDKGFLMAFLCGHAPARCGRWGRFNPPCRTWPYLVKYLHRLAAQLGPNFHERNYDGTIHRIYGDAVGRWEHTMSTMDVSSLSILRHEEGAEATAFEILSDQSETRSWSFLNSSCFRQTTRIRLDPGNQRSRTSRRPAGAPVSVHLQRPTGPRSDGVSEFDESARHYCCVVCIVR